MRNGAEDRPRFALIDRLGNISLVEVETRYGKLLVPDTKHDVIGRFLARYGEWGWDEVSFLAATLPSEGGRILDVGAFVGTFGLGLALQRDLEGLCFVEANSAVAPLLAENVGRSRTTHTTVINALVGRTGAQPRAGRCKNGNIGSMSFTDTLNATPASARDAPPPERVTTLEALRSEFGEFTLIKLDVEGMELELLESDEQYLSSGRAALWIECNEDPQSLAVAELLLSWGLDLYYFAFPAYNRDNFRGDRVPIFPMAYEAGLLAAPPSPPSIDSQLAGHHCILRPVHTVEDVKRALWDTPRWGIPEWDGASSAEVAASAGHLLRRETYDAYLRPGWRPGQFLSDLLDVEQARAAAAEARATTAMQEALDLIKEVRVQRDRSELAENRATTATQEVLALRKEILAQRDRADVAERLLAHASAQALDRLSEIGAERELRADAEARSAEFASRAANAEHRADAIERSTIWRVSGPFRRALGARPLLRGMFRRSAMGATDVLRLLRRR